MLVTALKGGGGEVYIMVLLPYFAILLERAPSSYTVMPLTMIESDINLLEGFTENKE
jgi:hypothetical protein